MHRIYGECAADNIGSARVMEQSGMYREALHRKAFFVRVDKKWVDKEVYAILAKNYIANKSRQQVYMPIFIQIMIFFADQFAA